MAEPADTCKLWYQWKRSFARARMLIKQGLTEQRAWRSATNGRGPWWNSEVSHMNHAYPKSYFDQQGHISLLDLMRAHWSYS
jgi:RNA-directed DNA polymerase